MFSLQYFMSTESIKVAYSKEEREIIFFFKTCISFCYRSSVVYISLYHYIYIIDRYRICFIAHHSERIYIKKLINT